MHLQRKKRVIVALKMGGRRKSICTGLRLHKNTENCAKARLISIGPVG